MRIDTSSNNMQDSEENRINRKRFTPPPPPGHNRAARRRIAKANKIFKDGSRSDWRMANNHMKKRNDIAQVNADRIKEARNHQ